jgi:hypothetical protein
MGPAQTQRALDGGVQRGNAGGAVIPAAGGLPLVVEEVGGFLMRAELAVHAAYELT